MWLLKHESRKIHRIDSERVLYSRKREVTEKKRRKDTKDGEPQKQHIAEMGNLSKVFVVILWTINERGSGFKVASSGDCSLHLTTF